MSEVGRVSPALQALYDEERAAPIGGDEDRARVRARVLTTVGAGAGVGGAAGVAGAAGAATAATFTGKIIVLAVALGAVGGGLYGRATSSSSSSFSDERRVVTPSVALAVAREVTTAPPLTPSVSRALTPSVAPTSMPAANAPVPTPSRAAPVVRVRPSSLPSSSAPPVASALAPAAPEHRARSATSNQAGATSSQYVLLARAHAALQRGEVQAALELVDRDRTANPESAFAEEREALRIVALRRLHRHAEARAVATAFASRHPDSVHRPLVDPARAEAP